MRKYTVTDVNYENGDVFHHDGKKYQRSHIGGAIFDLAFAGKKQVDEYASEQKRFNKNPINYMKSIDGGK